METLTHMRLKELLDYDPETGMFTWKISNRNSPIKIGSEAGTLDSGGYCQIKIDGTHYKAHRLAWLYVHNNWPKYQIDHINGIRADNRLANLRAATSSENSQNQRCANKDSKTGLLGIYPHGKKYVAQIRLNGKTHRLGIFQTPEEAHEVYLKAKRELHSHCTI